MSKIKRIFHTWDKWECYPSGFFEDKPPKGIDKSECLDIYKNFLSDLDSFERGLIRVTSEWVMSCEHNLTNDKMNRIAWLGQAALCIETGVPSSFRAGYSLLTDEEKHRADDLALVYLNKWLMARGEIETDGKRNHKSANIY